MTREQRQLAKVARTGNFYEVKKNVSNGDKTYYSVKGQSQRAELIGSKWEKRNDYENKIGRRAFVPGTKRKVMQGVNEASKKAQFPVGERLSDGRHRYFVKHGYTVDRLAS